jgi:arsenate reductase-like glutaredoxin family protein
MAFEDVGTKIVKYSKGKKGWLIAAVILLIVSAGLFVMEKSGGDTDKNAYIIYLTFSVICLVAYFLTFRRAFYLVNNNNTNAISFLVSRPSKEELDAFISELKDKRKEYLSAKYGRVTKLLSYEKQYNTLNWLNQSEVLSSEEYLLKLEELNKLFSGSNPIGGFHSR